MKKNPLKRYAPLKSKTRMRRVSKATGARMRVYKLARAEYLLNHRLCEVCKTREADQIHHKKGRVGELLYDKRYFLATDGICHSTITDNPTWARLKGYSLDRLAL